MKPALKLLSPNSVFSASCLLALLCLLLALWPASLPALAYEPAAMAAGEWWRGLSGQVVHLNFNHALMNAAGLAMLGLYFNRDFSLRAWLGLMLAAGLVIALMLWWREPGLSRYAGFSGVLHALLFAGLIRTWRELPWINSLVLLVLLGRLVWEQSPGYDPLYLVDWIGGRVMPTAHLGGALAGLAWGLLSLLPPFAAESRTPPPA